MYTSELSPMSDWFGFAKLEWFGGNIFKKRIANVNK